MSVRNVYHVVTSGGFIAYSGSYRSAMNVYDVLNSVMAEYHLESIYPITISFTPATIISRKEVRSHVEEDA